MSIIDTMQARLAVLAPSHLDIQDDSASHAGHAGAGSGGHYDVLIVSAAFNGKNRVQRQRLVYQALGDLMQNGIHALAMRTLTPEEI
ncbi:BolA family transcriptional regulator [Vogesella sp. XCS3]|uniref:BolA family protein n=1 Tax=Vogesella sp. XCS3 TaxID=2877939 RepID=UPI001D0A29FC|nr:BolA family protein [Vogesella sp. XCS3]UDM17982.1 BolA family transcriptional regulator [Vogesella sp. XCS3]